MKKVSEKVHLMTSTKYTYSQDSQRTELRRNLFPTRAGKEVDNMSGSSNGTERLDFVFSNLSEEE